MNQSNEDQDSVIYKLRLGIERHEERVSGFKRERWFMILSLVVPLSIAWGGIIGVMPPPLLVTGTGLMSQMTEWINGFSTPFRCLIWVMIAALTLSMWFWLASSVRLDQYNAELRRLKGRLKEREELVALIEKIVRAEITRPEKE